jgi:glycine C-acetyltransferase
VLAGFIAGPRQLIAWVQKPRAALAVLDQRASRPPSPPVEALDIIRDEPERIDRLWAETRSFKERLHELGFDIGASETPITPVITGDEEPIQVFARRLLEEGLFCQAIVFPTVARGQAGVRTIVTADHTGDDPAEASRCSVGSGAGVGQR